MLLYLLVAKMVDTTRPYNALNYTLTMYPFLKPPLGRGVGGIAFITKINVLTRFNGF